MYIKVSNDIKDLTGYGVEMLTDEYGNIIAEFYYGQILTMQDRHYKEQDKTLIIKYGIDI